MFACLTFGSVLGNYKALGKYVKLELYHNIRTKMSYFPCFILKVDLDLGNYERFLDIKLTRDNNITTGKIYQVSYRV